MDKEKKPIDFALPLRHLVGIAFFFVIAITGMQVFCQNKFRRCRRGLGNIGKLLFQ